MVDSISSSSTGYAQAYNSAQRKPPKHGGSPDEMFAKIDGDSSGTADKAEFSSLISEMTKMSGQTIDQDEAFSKLDSDGDGTISKTEMTKMKDVLPPPPPPEGFNNSDENENSETAVQTSAASKVSTYNLDGTANRNSATESILDLLG